MPSWRTSPTPRGPGPLQRSIGSRSKNRDPTQELCAKRLPAQGRQVLLYVLPWPSCRLIPAREGRGSQTGTLLPVYQVACSVPTAADLGDQSNGILGPQRDPASLPPMTRDFPALAPTASASRGGMQGRRQQGKIGCCDSFPGLWLHEEQAHPWRVTCHGK